MGHDLTDHLLRDFLMLLVTIDPVGTLMVFLGLSAGMSAEQRRRVAIRAVAYAAAILVAFIFRLHLPAR